MMTTQRLQTKPIYAFPSASSSLGYTENNILYVERNTPELCIDVFDFSATKIGWDVNAWMRDPVRFIIPAGKEVILKAFDSVGNPVISTPEVRTYFLYKPGLSVWGSGVILNTKYLDGNALKRTFDEDTPVGGLGAWISSKYLKESYIQFILTVGDERWI